VNTLALVGLDPADAQIIGDYLAAVGSRLPIGRRTREEILTELADGLACAVAEEIGRGLAPGPAAHAAVTQFGEPAVLAAAFARQLASAAAHRVGLGLVTTGPLVGLIWVGAASSSGPTWPSRISGVLSALPLYPLILAMTVPAAMIAITGSGWAARRFPVFRRLATGSAFVAVLGCIAGDVSLLSGAVFGGAAWAAAPTGLTLVAVAVSLVRLSVAGFAGSRVFRLMAAGN
jgi:hypothetical protein